MSAFSSVLNHDGVSKGHHFHGPGSSKQAEITRLKRAEVWSFGHPELGNNGCEAGRSCNYAYSSQKETKSSASMVIAKFDLRDCSSL